MRRLSILLALILATAMPALGWTEPPMLTYKNTVLMEGKSKEEINKKACEWIETQGKIHNYYCRGYEGMAIWHAGKTK